MEKLYLTIEEAAQYVGIGEKALRNYMDDDPIPYLRVGNKKLLQRAALAEYFERKQEVRK